MSSKGWQYSEENKTLVGTSVEKWVNVNTGEEREIQSVHKRIYGSKQFWKIYLMDFLQILGVLDSKQVDILIYILENTEQANNTFIGTYQKIQKAVNVSAPTVARVMVKLQENNFLKKVQNGVWQVSPSIMMKGSDFKKQLLINYYQDDSPMEPPVPQKKPLELVKGDSIKSE